MKRRRNPFQNEEEKKICMNLDGLQDDTLDVSSVENMTMLELITAINSTLDEVGMGEEGMAKTKLWLNALARRQGLSAKKMFVIAVVMNFYVENGANIDDITTLCKCNNMSVLLLLPEIEQLVADGLLTKDTGPGVLYNISIDLLKAYRDNRPCAQKDYKCADRTQLLSIYFDLTHQLYVNRIDHDVFKYRFNLLLDNNAELPLVKALCSMGLYDYLKPVVLHLCRHLVLHAEPEINIQHNVLYLFEEGPTRNNVGSDMLHGEGELFDRGIIEYASNNGMRDTSSIRLTAKARKHLLGAFKMPAKGGKKSDTTSIVLHKNIAEKTLFFDSRVEQQVKQLGDLLSDDNFRSIQSRLKEKGMRTGFTCMFYGTPGTGKTETALQLARATGRDIMQVNISEIRSMWVGESEKNIQALFDDYRQQVKARKRCPILLFNEADAVFNQRNENSKRSVDKMENSIQNIILQEMEKLDGILIATTNLQGNLDKAFERRFLYKVEFSRPSLEARTNIWRTLMPSLDESTAQQLARDYDLSGGQIENVARKSMVDEILYGTTSTTAPRLRQYCDDERLDKCEHRRIGFTAA